jgi:WD40 repeat protein
MVTEPTREQLRAFLAGGLSEADQSDLCEHVERCARCQLVLEELVAGGEGPEWSSWRRDEGDLRPDETFLMHLKGSGPPAGWSSLGWGPPAEEGEASRPEGVPGSARARGWPPVIRGYEVFHELGRGGMGVVYLAREVRLNRPCALKMILAAGQAGPDAVVRFLAEAEAIARLRHQNIVQVHAAGDHDGHPYLELEYVEGGSLARALDGTPWPPPPAARLVADLAAAMDAAHRSGVVHRDLKPGNILLTADGTPKVTDFGLAKSLGDSTGPTLSGAILGTPSYMAPEQAEGDARQVGPEADIYAMGAILYELLTGRPPFRGATVLETLQQVKSAEPAPPSRLVPGLPRDIELVCLKCLEKDPRRRYAVASDLASDLERFLAGEPVLARAPSALDRWGKFARRNKAVVVGVAGVMTALGLGIAATSLMALRESRARRQSDRNAERATRYAQQAEDARSASRRESYQARLAAAMAAMGTHDVREAARQLELAPRELRGWEWRHLHARLDQSLAVVAGLPEVGKVAFCPPGERIAVAEGRAYRLLDATSGECLAVRTIDSECRRVFAFRTHAGPRFVLDLSERTLSLALTDEGVSPLARIAPPTRYPPGMKPDLSAMAMSPDGTRLAFQSVPSRTAPVIELFDTATGRRTAACENPGANLLALDFSPDGRRLAAALESSQVFIFDAATGHRLATFPGHIGSLRAVAYSPDGRRLASSGDDQTIRVWDAGTGRTLHTLRGHAGRVACVAFSPDGRRLASGGSDRTVRVWEAGGGEASLVLRGHAATVNRVAFGADGRTLASASSDGTARLWDATAPEDACILRHKGHVYAVAYGPDGRRIASGSWDGRVRLWDAVDAGPVHTLEDHHQTIGALAFTPDGTRLASWGEDRMIRLWDAATGKAIAVLRHENMRMRDSVYSLVVSPDGKRLGASSADGVHFWDLSTGDELATLHLPLAGVRVVAISPDGDRLAAAGDDVPKVVVVDATSGERIAELTGFTGRIQSIAFSPDGRTVLTAGQDPALRLWDAATGRLVRTFVGHGLEVLAAVFHPDGTRIASGGHDRSILIWDTAVGEELLRLPGHASYVFSLAFSPDGETLVSGSGDYTVRLWDTFPVARRLRARRVTASPRPSSPLAARPDPPPSH